MGHGKSCKLIKLLCCGGRVLNIEHKCCSIITSDWRKARQLSPEIDVLHDEIHGNLTSTVSADSILTGDLSQSHGDTGDDTGDNEDDDNNDNDCFFKDCGHLCP